MENKVKKYTEEFIKKTKIKDYSLMDAIYWINNIHDLNVTSEYILLDNIMSYIKPVKEDKEKIIQLMNREFNVLDDISNKKANNKLKEMLNKIGINIKGNKIYEQIEKSSKLAEQNNMDYFNDLLDIKQLFNNGEEEEKIKKQIIELKEKYAKLQEYFVAADLKAIENMFDKKKTEIKVIDKNIKHNLFLAIKAALSIKDPKREDIVIRANIREFYKTGGILDKADISSEKFQELIKAARNAKESLLAKKHDKTIDDLIEKVLKYNSFDETQLNFDL